MSDSKSKYSAGVSAQTAVAQLDAALKGKLDKAAIRAQKYHANWQPVNLNDFVERFAPGSTPKLDGSKIIFHSPGSSLEIICDVRGGYCRLQDRTNATSRCYLDINGHPLGNKILPSGKQAGRSKAEYNELTHFRILKREEM